MKVLSGRLRPCALASIYVGVAVTAAAIVLLRFCPRYHDWKGVVLVNGPLAVDYGRGVAAFHQIANPWAPVVIPLHKIIAWRLLFPVTWHYLKLPFWLYLAMPHIGCVVTLSLVAQLCQARLRNWPYTWMTTAIAAALPWFFVSSGWLGYFDSWLVLGMLVVSFVRSRSALVAACLLVPWIDERFVLALPLCMTLRFITMRDDASEDTRGLWNDTLSAVSASLIYPAIRLIAWQFGERLGADYASAHWEELHRVSWDQFFDGLWSGYRAAWIFIVAGVFFWWRRAGWNQGIWLSLVIAVSAIGTLFIAADMSRSTMIMLPALLFGIWLWSAVRPRSFRLVLPLVLVANLALPAAHVMWNLRLPIRSFFAVRAEPRPPYLDPAEYVRQAEASLTAGSLKEGDLALDAAIRLDSRFAPAYTLRAFQRAKEGEWAGAGADIQIALELNPNSPDALLVRALIAGNENDIATAKANLQKALRLAPVDWPRGNAARALLDKLNSRGF